MNRFVTPTGAFRAWWSVSMILVAAVLVGLANVAYTNYVDRESERRYAEQQAREKRVQAESRRRGLVMVCAWLAPRVNPLPAPETDRGRAQLKADQQLYAYFGCKGVRP